LIAFVRYRSEILADIFVIPALGGAERKVASGDLHGVRGKYATSYGWTGNLSWTPDGKWLGFGGAPARGSA
jgi:hypothetical protein